ncbi:MAG: hypothetical protein OXO49_08785 [Gammaproteobacteria bacterium]|nr:hypothetical protein [Gammaproteobacteria bacterium]MDE0252665.1 hypothetical protein [Gammaproteobacteria bacterium]MDE0403577.1 hypothetical protein [Gammaproteobacteria bacterium]
MTDKTDPEFVDLRKPRLDRVTLCKQGITSNDLFKAIDQRGSDFGNENGNDSQPEFKEIRQLTLEARARRWSPARDIPWQSIRALPPDIESSINQICTTFLQFANTDLAILINWLPRIDHATRDEKSFLITTVFDAARRFEAFQYRAAVSGEDVALTPTSHVCQYLCEIESWLEALTSLCLIRGLFELTVFEYLSRHSYNVAERILYSNVIQDIARFASYGLVRVRDYNARNAHTKRSVSSIIEDGLKEFRLDLRVSSFCESLATIFAGGRGSKKSNGLSIFNEMVQIHIERLQKTLIWLDIGIRPTEFLNQTDRTL